MKNTTPAFDALAQAAGTELATCWKITRNDNAVFGFTTHDQKVEVDGVSYVAISGFSPSSVESKEGLNVDNVDVQSMVMAAQFNEAEMQACRWDYAKVEIFQVNWRTPSVGRLLIRSGTLGEVVFTAQADRASVSGNYKSEVRGMMQPLQQTVGRSVSAMCRDSLGGPVCKKALAPLTRSVTVTSVSANQKTIGFAAQAAPADTANYFAYGKATFTSGTNNNLSMEMVASTAASIKLFQPMPYPVAMGDVLSITAGCDRHFSTCCNKHDNAVNFDGEPHVPGQDKIMQPGR